MRKNLEDTNAQAELLITRLGKIAVGAGMASQTVAVREAVRAAAPEFVGGTDAAVSSVESFINKRPSGSSPEEIKSFLAAAQQANYAGLDLKQFSQAVGSLSEIGFDMQKAADIAAVATQAGDKGGAALEKAINSYVFETKADRRSPEGFQRYFESGRGMEKENALTRDTMRGIFQSGALGNLVRSADDDQARRRANENAIAENRRLAPLASQEEMLRSQEMEARRIRIAGDPRGVRGFARAAQAAAVSEAETMLPGAGDAAETAAEILSPVGRYNISRLPRAIWDYNLLWQIPGMGGWGSQTPKLLTEGTRPQDQPKRME
jgi:hypothetical protein